MTYDEVSVEVAPAGSLSRAEVVDLYDAVGWTAYTGDPDRLMKGIAASYQVVVARVEGRLVGLARLISDGATIAYVQDILVHPSMRRRGIGRRLMTELFDGLESLRQQVLVTDDEPGQRAFYESLGFTEIRDADVPLRAFLRWGRTLP